jgi:hypothetical protein
VLPTEEVPESTGRDASPTSTRRCGAPHARSTTDRRGKASLLPPEPPPFHYRPRGYHMVQKSTPSSRRSLPPRNYSPRSELSPAQPPTHPTGSPLTLLARPVNSTSCSLPKPGVPPRRGLLALPLAELAAGTDLTAGEPTAQTEPKMSRGPTPRSPQNQPTEAHRSPQKPTEAHRSPQNQPQRQDSPRG